MKRYRYKAERLFFMTLWTIILILSFTVLIKGINVLGNNGLAKSSESLKEKFITVLSNYVLETHSPLLHYVEDTNGDAKGYAFNGIIHSFPINEYVARADTVTERQYIENNPMLYTSNDNILMGPKEYLSLILQGAKAAGSTGTDVKNENNYEEEAVAAESQGISNPMLPIDIINGEFYMEDEGTSNVEDYSKQAVSSANGEHYTLAQLENKHFLYNNFYIIDGTTSVNDAIFDAEKMLSMDMTLKAKTDKPQILIYHTHSQEAFSDSREGAEDETVVGVGNVLVNILEKDYGYNVVHDKTKYDMMGGYLDRNLAYNYAADGVSKILKKNPTIEVIIDLHRDGGNKRVVTINGEKVANVMLFNGLSRNSKGEDIGYLYNPNLQANLAFSLQLQLKGRELFPGYMYKNYLKGFRFNLHLRKKSILAEVGTINNTVAEEKNSMKYLAEVLHQVLSGEN
ncbi:stage II sporulation protein P [Anaerocolumna xylanovorans]|uniref:Stage II sporulation protein P n=1 Tax=Anaerocolumna xylanovorans DSM 12503 TaxID=1121345 RepID=A0A1M7YN31_9FIRM|nr:stage II sporulation protein P [Anaerocolumna xylanovorans]SHO54005.1 stage II sporulation protein P [Anaerocolumna xylanovorans DSM 12503]